MSEAVSHLSEITPPNAPFAPTEFKLGLYVIVDSYEWVERLIHAGVKTLQIRIKDRSSEQAEEEIARCIALAKQHLTLHCSFLQKVYVCNFLGSCMFRPKKCREERKAPFQKANCP